MVDLGCTCGLLLSTETALFHLFATQETIEEINGLVHVSSLHKRLTLQMPSLSQDCPYQLLIYLRRLNLEAVCTDFSIVTQWIPIALIVVTLA